MIIKARWGTCGGLGMDHIRLPPAISGGDHTLVRIDLYLRFFEISIGYEEKIRAEFICRKDSLAGLRNILLLPTVEVSDNSFWRDKYQEKVLEGDFWDFNQKMLYISARWLRFRLGFGLHWK